MDEYEQTVISTENEIYVLASSVMRLCDMAQDSVKRKIINSNVSRISDAIEELSGLLEYLIEVDS